MLKQFFAWCRRKEPLPLEGENIYETLLNQLEDIDEIAKRGFNLPKTRTVLLRTATVNLEDLSDYLIDASVTITKGDSLAGRWTTRALQYELGTLESFISEANALVHPIDWVIQHKLYIVKLLDAFLQMDSADRDYYQRKCNFVVEDLLALLKASRECLR
ncbi:hypothetical protein D3C73_205310 [compost metagenome]|jgi:hypothetical protein